MDAVSVWFLDLVAAYLAKTAIPKVLVNLIIAAIAKQLTADNRAKLKMDLECFVCRHLHDIASSKDGSKWNDLLGEVAELLDCTDCKPAPVIQADAPAVAVK